MLCIESLASSNSIATSCYLVKPISTKRHNSLCLVQSRNGSGPELCCRWFQAVATASHLLLRFYTTKVFRLICQIESQVEIQTDRLVQKTLSCPDAEVYP